MNNDNIESLSSVIKKLEEATRRAIDAAEVAARKIEESARRETEAISAERAAREERERCQRATATLTMQTETLVNRLTDEAQFVRKRRDMIAQLDAEEEEMRDSYDAKEAWLQRQVMNHVPEIAKTLKDMDVDDLERRAE